MTITLEILPKFDERNTVDNSLPRKPKMLTMTWDIAERAKAERVYSTLIAQGHSVCWVAPHA